MDLSCSTYEAIQFRYRENLGSNYPKDSRSLDIPLPRSLSSIGPVPRVRADNARSTARNASTRSKADPYRFLWLLQTERTQQPSPMNESENSRMRILGRFQFSNPKNAIHQPYVLLCKLRDSNQPPDRHMAQLWLNISHETNGSFVNLPISRPIDTIERPGSPRPERRQDEFGGDTQRPGQTCRASIRNFSRSMQWIYLFLHQAAPRQRRRQRPAGYQRIQHRSRHAAHWYVRQSLVRIRRSDCNRILHTIISGRLNRSREGARERNSCPSLLTR
ncbi:hypothetical protein ACVWWD_003860 [Mesorhizobium sp. URHB0026]